MLTLLLTAIKDMPWLILYETTNKINPNKRFHPWPPSISHTTYVNTRLGISNKSVRQHQLTCTFRISIWRYWKLHVLLYCNGQLSKR